MVQRTRSQRIARRNRLKKAADEEAAERKRLADEEAAEQKRLADEEAAEQKRLADEQAAEEKRLADEQAAEQKRLADEQERERQAVADAQIARDAENFVRRNQERLQKKQQAPIRQSPRLVEKKQQAPIRQSPRLVEKKQQAPLPQSQRPQPKPKKRQAPLPQSQRLQPKPKKRARNGSAPRVRSIRKEGNIILPDVVMQRDFHAGLNKYVDIEKSDTKKATKLLKAYGKNSRGFLDKKDDVRDWTIWYQGFVQGKSHAIKRKFYKAGQKAYEERRQARQEARAGGGGG